MVRFCTIFALCVATLVVRSWGHEPLTNGTSTGPDWSTWQNALTIPSNKFSLAARRVSNAAGPVFWLQYSAQAGDVLYVGAGSGVALANRVLRATVFAFGAGLARKYRAAMFKVGVPTGPNFGYQVYKSPKLLNNCKFLTTPNAKTGNQVVTYSGVTRCGSYNNVTGTGYFPLMDYNFTAPATGTYYFAAFLDATWEAGWYFSSGAPYHSHDENKTLPTPPPGNAASVNVLSPNITVTSFIGGVAPFPFSILR